MGIRQSAVQLQSQFRTSSELTQNQTRTISGSNQNHRRATVSKLQRGKFLAVEPRRKEADVPLISQRRSLNTFIFIIKMDGHVTSFYSGRNKYSSTSTERQLLHYLKALLGTISSDGCNRLTARFCADSLDEKNQHYWRFARFYCRQ